MVKWCVRAAMALALLAVVGGGVRAQQVADDPAFWSASVGYYDINDNMDAAEARIDYRAATKYLRVFKPWGGLMGTSDGAAHLYGGFLVDVYFGNRLVLTPYSAAGLYYDGNGKDLGHPIQFRSGLELAYRFDNRARLGLGIAHISNASLGDSNPGTEIVSLTYSLPIN